MTRKTTKKSAEVKADEVTARYYDEATGELKPVENNAVPATDNYTGVVD